MQNVRPTRSPSCSRRDASLGRPRSCSKARGRSGDPRRVCERRRTRRAPQAGGDGATCRPESPPSPRGGRRRDAPSQRRNRGGHGSRRRARRRRVSPARGALLRGARAARERVASACRPTAVSPPGPDSARRRAAPSRARQRAWRRILVRQGARAPRAGRGCARRGGRCGPVGGFHSVGARHPSWSVAEAPVASRTRRSRRQLRSSSSTIRAIAAQPRSQNAGDARSKPSRAARSTGAMLPPAASSSR